MLSSSDKEKAFLPKRYGLWRSKESVCTASLLTEPAVSSSPWHNRATVLATRSRASQSSALYAMILSLRLGSLENSHLDLQASALNPEAGLTDHLKPRY